MTALFPLPDGWDWLRWVNVALAASVVMLMIAGAMRRWDAMPKRFRRITPWVITTYVIIAYGSGEVASTPGDVDPGLRVLFMVANLSGLMIALLYRIDDETYEL